MAARWHNEHWVLLAACKLLLLTGCSRWDGISCPVEAKVVAATADKLQIRLRLRNMHTFPIWVASAGPNGARTSGAFLGFPVSDQLVLVFGDLELTEGRQGPWGPDFSMKKIVVAPGECYECTVDIAIPYKPEHGVENPYEDDFPIYAGHRMRRVWVAVQYWLECPSRYPDACDLLDRDRLGPIGARLARIRLAEGLLTGQIHLSRSFREQGAWGRIAVSEPIDVDIPVDTSKRFFFFPEG